MKKLILKITAVLALAATMFTMTACGDKKDKKTESETQAIMQARWVEEFSSFDDCKSYALTSYVYISSNHKDDETVKIDYVIRTTNYYDVNNNAASTGYLAVKVLTPGYLLTDIESYKNTVISLTPEENKCYFDGEWYIISNDPIYFVEEGDKSYSVYFDTLQKKYVGKVTGSADFGDARLTVISMYKMLGSMYEYVESLGEFKPKDTAAYAAYLDNVVISLPENGGIKIDYFDDNKTIIMSLLYHSVNGVTVTVPEYTIVDDGETPATDGESPATDGETPATDGEMPATDDGSPAIDGDGAAA